MNGFSITKMWWSKNRPGIPGEKVCLLGLDVAATRAAVRPIQLNAGGYMLIYIDNGN
jgi:hypothetical protein